ncbi:type I-E CRISPR-associated protein Cas7/Cse4/CasC [Corynebacterium heidelbergense]|uniref:Type I-E CRISPR-associated protein Cas7/Cse4/CasC n=1 Tax=Corynebacterium heidelbergense TaxID=2055947 RepID=A0A364V4Y2_9CORY|nr:type I-E CRISPR-associated protein Cas7/Cse4/CasC [Corynebacterium heidelbergense]RAV31703.1 type I-E CRISPR-associated protein Cas7/Cse4/CasC [Corynebacterium heidelbergense]
MTTYIDIHVLQLVPPSCINRDDTGSPKSARFGGVPRHRVSSQAWKRAVRAELQSMLPEESLGERTKFAISRVAETIKSRHPEVDDEAALDASRAVFTAAGVSPDKKHPDQTGALMFISRQELARLADIAAESMTTGGNVDKKAARQALVGNEAVDIALFGRMLADAPELNIDAACQVEHALSIHRAANEFDFFTAVDDNAPEDNSGAGMMGTVEFVSSTLYRYATINVDRLVSNIGDREAAATAAETFVKAFALSMPTGRQNTFANRTRPDFVWVEIREDQPVSWVNAFEASVANDGNAVALGVQKMVEHAVSEDRLYGTAPAASTYVATSRVLTDKVKGALEGRSKAGTLAELAELAASAARRGE